MKDKKHRDIMLDVIKGICMICIITSHAQFSEGIKLKYLFPYTIDMAVPVLMMISGYLGAKSMSQKQICTVADAYSSNVIVPKLLRFLIPACFVIACETVLHIIYAVLTKELIGFEYVVQCVKDILSGGYGPGSYYTPIMIQFIFAFPVIYFIISQKGFRGLLQCLIINFVYEVLKTAYGMNTECYRLLLFRYIFLIAVGCYAEEYGTKIQLKWAVSITFIGALYIYLTKYMNYKPVIFEFWIGTSMLAVMWVIPSIYSYLCKSERKIIKILKPISLIGNASFNVYLSQMAYYEFGFPLVSYVIPDKKIRLLISLVISVSCGLLFYAIESPITKKITNRYISRAKLTR